MIPTGLSAISSDHGLPQERFYNLICLALGADHGDLPIWRIIYLQHDSRTVRMNTEHWCVPSKGKITPHLDQEMATQVRDFYTLA